MVALAVAVSATLVPAAVALGSPTAGAALATGSRAHGAAASRPACHQPAPASPVVATPVPGSTTDWTITSFDGTQIRAHWFPVALPASPSATGSAPPAAPTLLEGPGWGESGDTSLTASGGFGIPSIDQMHQAGYNVLTWDPRGWGVSTGTVETDSAQYEGRDVSELIDWLATRPGVALNGPDDPEVGMVGGSYGGGIQFAAASVDCRIEAIVPTIAWHSLVTSLYKAATPKDGWGDLLYAAAGGHQIDPVITESHTAMATGSLPASAVAWYAARSDYVTKDDIPTLIMQGTVDNLFTLDEGVANYEDLRARNVPVAMMWFCGGHGVCLTNEGNQQLLTQDTFAWLDRYLKGDTHAATFPRFQFVDQNGVEYHAADYPLPLTTPFTATGSGTLALVATGGSGPAHPPANSPSLLAGVAGDITPSKATNAVDVVVPTGSRDAVVAGAPHLTLTYQGTAPAGPLPTRVYAQLVDDATGLVLGNQITPIDVTLDGHPHTTSVPLETVVYHATPGQHVTLQLVASTTAYGPNRLGGHVDFSHIALTLPVAEHP